MNLSKYKRMKKNLLVIILIGITGVMSGIIVFQTDFVSRFKNKRSSNTELKSKSANLIGDIYGIDVSRHQGKIDWKKVRRWKNKNLDFVYIKATEGATYVDETYKRISGRRKKMAY